MSFGAGHVQDMNNRMKQNRNQRPSKRARFKEYASNSINAIVGKKKKRQYKTVSEEELSAIKSKIREKANADRMRLKRFYLISISLGLLLLVAFILYIKLS